MTTPTATVILTEIGLRLANITVANGYHNTVKSVDRARLKPFKGYDLPAVNYWSTGMQNERTVYNDDNRTLSVFIEIHSMTRDLPFVDVANSLASDVVTAVVRKDTAPQVSDAPDYNLTDTVDDLILRNISFIIGEGQEPWCGALIEFEVKYRCEPFVMDGNDPIVATSQDLTITTNDTVVSVS